MTTKYKVGEFLVHKHRSRYRVYKVYSITNHYYILNSSTPQFRVPIFTVDNDRNVSKATKLHILLGDFDEKA